MRSGETQIHHDETRMTEPVRNVATHNEMVRRSMPNPELPHTDIAGQGYDFSFSFEDINTIGFEEAPQPTWQVLINLVYLFIFYFMVNHQKCLPLS